MFRQQWTSFRLMVRRATVRAVLGGTIVVGAIEITTQLPSQGRSSLFYHYLADDVVTPTMRRVFNPEEAHEYAIQTAQTGWIPVHHPSAAEQTLDVSTTIARSALDEKSSLSSQPRLVLDNPVGLAAGFDKDGRTIQSMFDLGFGFVEIGSVTLRPQPGNPKPRMFRIPHEEAVINRYGFNSMGADFVHLQLKAFRQKLEARQTSTINWYATLQRWLERAVSQKDQGQDTMMETVYTNKPEENAFKGMLGINLGKNKTSETATEDYQTLITRLGPYADYLVVNISSPNTPGLRDLQRVEPLRKLLVACLEARDKLRQESSSLPPLFVKLAPDLSHEEMQDIANLLLEIPIDGMILTNTTSGRPQSWPTTDVDRARDNTAVQFLRTPKIDQPNSYRESGGLSGKPLRDKSTECIRTMYALTHGTIPIIGVGGISSGRDAYEKLKAGASAVQLYTGLVYNGPGLVSRIRHELAQEMIQHGEQTLDDVIGSDHTELYMQRKLRIHQLVEQQQQQQQ